ncbi:hypothetical protein C2W62_17625 [Candidatus Entotheonella serta]|nr:hypothetical protein C2W62_17625 [Candidatus Entotheonella serta]
MSDTCHRENIIRPDTSCQIRCDYPSPLPIREVADHVKHLLPNAQIDVKPGTWGGGMHYEMATTEAEIGYSPQVPLAEGLRRNINDLRRLNGLPVI